MKQRFGVVALLLGLMLPAAAPSAFSQEKFHLKPGARGKLCLECHLTFKETVALPFVHTPVKAGECTDCHNPHAASHGKLLSADAGAICAGCHAGIAPEGARSVHVPAAAGECVRCHDPHASKNRNTLKSPASELCAGCHAEVTARVARAKFKHDPAGKSCLACHDPHASSKAGFLLKKEPPGLCTDCHRTDQPGFAKQHLNYPVARSRCTSCHDPHGSDNSGILRATVHAPLANRMCNQCHLDPSSPNALSTRKPGFELCRGCHGQLLNETLSKNRVHWPAVDKVACLNCHSPHASTEKALLRQPPKLLCGGCHADTLARQEKSAAKHPPVDEANCTACHSPHASDQVFLLPARGVTELCGTCHEWRQHSNHPLGQKFADPRNKNLTLDCLSCHRSHGSPYKALAHFDTEADLCVQCHAEMRR